ncbi:MAG: 16S rRNA (cytosine(1402)-N(4))-methyltransferase RsmH [Terrimicrobiaceae bacterium]|jgi:16S rRNA (cytosine1402-N4)-methyltransferase
MNSWDFDDLSLQTLEKPDEAYHIPVMTEEVSALLRPAPGLIFLDGTAGGGGHSEMLLQHGAEVIAIDQDADAVATCRARLAPYAHRLHLWEGNYEDSPSVLEEFGIAALGGALLDLGLSSYQVDTASRGFAMMKNGPLDMRMSRKNPHTAADLVNTASPAELARIFREYGEEPRAMHIAARIAALREDRLFRTTFDLAAAVTAVVPRTGARHPATRVFQALRIAVNDELGVLTRGLEAISGRLAHGARFAVISFHSLEDRIVKTFFRERSAEWIDRPEWPEPRRNPARIFRLLTPRPMDASVEETQSNPRARSAKLRVVERI